MPLRIFIIALCTLISLDKLHSQRKVFTYYMVKKEFANSGQNNLRFDEPFRVRVLPLNQNIINATLTRLSESIQLDYMVLGNDIILIDGLKVNESHTLTKNGFLVLMIRLLDTLKV